MARRKKTDIERQSDRIKKETIKQMKAIEVYQDAYLPTIIAYAKIRAQAEDAQKKFEEGGCILTEKYTNKAGAENTRKSVLYQILETLRKDVLTYETALGLTPQGYKKLKKVAAKTPSKGFDFRSLEDGE